MKNEAGYFVIRLPGCLHVNQNLYDVTDDVKLQNTIIEY